MEKNVQRCISHQQQSQLEADTVSQRKQNDCDPLYNIFFEKMCINNSCLHIAYCHCNITQNLHRQGTVASTTNLAPVQQVA